MTDTRPTEAAPIEEAEAFLAKHPDIAAFDLVLIDPNGIARGKIIRRHELLGLYRSGRHLPGSILGLDVTGEDVDETGLVWDDGDADRRAWPISGSLVELPWTSPKRGEVRVSLYELDGTRMDADPRHALSRQIEALDRIGMTPVMAFELEFYLLDAARDAYGRPQAARMPITGDLNHTNQVYSLDPLDNLQTFIAELYAHAEVQGLPVETMISEYAPGQYELTLRHRSSGLRAADDLIMLKRLVRGLAIRHGMRANFMAKPFAGCSGSGMHLHTSLTDKAGTNLMADTGDELAPLLLSAVAGLQKRLAESMLIFAPNINSWRRFGRNSYAPTAATWGRNNRSVAIRVPAGPAASRHIEHRTAGVDANPYLVAASVLAGMYEGIRDNLTPDAEATSYEAESDHVLPKDWAAAIARAAGSTFVRDALGEKMAHVFLALRQSEYDRFMAQVTAEEFDYFGNTI
ncbi:glutamine synthetase family protein [Sagittula stellata]|uniref:Probable glutamine synthetase n=1 Tax=Sagittula stellata (strain ATCC 700073 / DSM 11524 / E-37) TaxID=388399 RepID=A3JXL9_SAGS3|nr:glutamine synthetase family protein [Sagittula stellata]EBA10255.1 probable glutamine synthetase [Sagittula stellata E-37]